MAPTSLTSFCVVATLFGAGICVRVGDDETDDQIAILDANSTLQHECFKNDYEPDACCKRDDYGSPCKSNVITGKNNLFWGGESQCGIYDELLECFSVSSDIQTGAQFDEADKEKCLATMFADPKSLSKEDLIACCGGATAEGIKGWRLKENATLQTGRLWAGASMLTALVGDANFAVGSDVVKIVDGTLITALNGKTFWSWVKGKEPTNPQFPEIVYVGLLATVLRAMAAKDMSWLVGFKAYAKTAAKIVGGIVTIATVVGTTIISFGGSAVVAPPLVAGAFAFLATANAADTVADKTSEIQNLERLYDEIYCRNGKPAPKRPSLLER